MKLFNRILVCLASFVLSTMLVFFTGIIWFFLFTLFGVIFIFVGKYITVGGKEDV